MQRTDYQPLKTFPVERAFAWAVVYQHAEGRLTEVHGDLHGQAQHFATMPGELDESQVALIASAYRQGHADGVNSVINPMGWDRHDTGMRFG